MDSAKIEEKRCVYTVLLGNYEELNEQPVVKDSGIDFICITDNPNLESDSWKIMEYKPIFPLDAARSSRFPKICPHKFLSDYDVSLYIDNSIILKTVPETIINDLLDETDTFVCMQHSFRDTIYKEFEEVTRIQYDFINKIMEQLNSYFLINPEILAKKPSWGGFLLRRHNDPKIIEAMEKWFFHVLRYSKRDQLSMNYVLDEEKISIKELNFDLHSSKYHEWPKGKRFGSPNINIELSSNLENIVSIFSYENQIQEKHTEQKVLNSKLFEQYNSDRILKEKDLKIQELEGKIAEMDQTIIQLQSQLTENNQLFLSKLNKIFKNIFKS